MLDDHSTQRDEFRQGQIALRVVCSPSTDLEIRLPSTVPDVIDGGQEAELRLVSPTAAPCLDVVVCAEERPVEEFARVEVPTRGVLDGLVNREFIPLIRR